MKATWSADVGDRRVGPSEDGDVLVVLVGDAGEVVGADPGTVGAGSDG
jgi:hypothetical protein